jgi:hypothetical protein
MSILVLRLFELLVRPLSYDLDYPDKPENLRQDEYVKIHYQQNRYL